MSKSDGSPVDTRGQPQPVPRHVVDLRRTRVPEIEIVACPTYDLLLSLQVALASPEYDYADYDVGQDWVVSARRRAEEHSAGALAVLERYLGHGLPSSLHATLISLVAECPPPRDPAFFLDWLARISISQFIQVLLDNAGQGTAWHELLAPALPDAQAHAGADPSAVDRLLDCFAGNVRPSVKELIQAPEQSRHELLAALWVWENAIFAEEEPRITPYVEREAAVLVEQQAELPRERFLKLAMRGVEWRGQVDFRRIILAPSYFCRPAVYFHEWHGTLTFCIPVETALLETIASGNLEDPRAPSEEILRFFLTLGDKTRLRILRLLSERDMYLTELAERLGLTKATTKHHMVMLRANGFVVLYERDRMTYYTLRPEISRHAAQLIREYLGQK
jgi:DNA-binding transcriptional ArsR family regulator